MPEHYNSGATQRLGGTTPNQLLPSVLLGVHFLNAREGQRVLNVIVLCVLCVLCVFVLLVLWLRIFKRPFNNYCPLGIVVICVRGKLTQKSSTSNLPLFTHSRLYRVRTHWDI